MTRRPARGHTLLEVVTVLALVGAALLPAVSGTRRILDRLAVEGAREELRAVLSRARLEAILRGGARVVITEDPALALLIVSGDGPWTDGPQDALALERRELGNLYRIQLEVGGRARRAELHFGALGLGMMTSRTLRLSRGGSEARLVVSTYGRVRRR